MLASYGTVPSVAAPMAPRSRRNTSVIAVLAGLALVAAVALTYSTHRVVLEDSNMGGGSGVDSSLGRNTDGISKSTLEGQAPPPAWHAQGGTAPPSPPARALPVDYLAFFQSDYFKDMSDTCCKTIFFPPGHGERLPMDLELDGPYVLRLRNFIGGRNSFIFNGADSYTIAFMNRYFGYNIKELPVVSSFKRRESLMVMDDPTTPSSIPTAWALERKVGATYYGGLPDKLTPTEDMVSVDTLSLPGASIIVYNNWPRVPTGTPGFIARYCQIQDPYKEGGVPMKVEVIECPAAEAKGYPCSCGFINFVGWNWLASNANVWDSSVINGDDAAWSYNLGGNAAKAAEAAKLRSGMHILHQQTTRVTQMEDCSGPNCHF